MGKSNYELMLEDSALFRKALEAKNIVVDPAWNFNIQRSTISCDLRKDLPVLSTYFGSQVVLRNVHDFRTLNSHLSISVGSSGSFNMECKASVEKHLLTAIFIQNFDEVAKIVNEHCCRVKLKEEQTYYSRHNRGSLLGES